MSTSEGTPFLQPIAHHRSPITVSMKRHLPIIVLAAVFLGLGVYLYFVDLPGERRKAEIETAEKKLLPFEEHDVTALTVRISDMDIVLAQREARAWTMTAPIATDADTREVEGLIRALLLGKVNRVVEEQTTALAPFGLEHPSVVVTLTAGDRTETVSLGDTGPISSTLYALRESDRKVLLTDLAAKDFLNKNLFTFRRKDVLPVDYSKAERLRLTYPNTEMVLSRAKEKAEAGQWRLSFPIEAEADQAEVRRLLIRLEDLKALGFVDGSEERARLAKTLTRSLVKVTVYAQGVEHLAKLFQPAPSSGEAYAVTSSDAPIARINPMIIKDLTKDLFTLRDKRLLGMNRSDLATLTVKTREHAYTLINQNNEWVLEDAPTAKLDQQEADLFVSRIVNLPAEIQVLKQPGQLAAYGLSSPAAEFAARGRDGKARGRLVLGTKTGGLVYAIGEGLPGIHQARADILTQIPSRDSLLVTKPKDEGTS